MSACIFIGPTISVVDAIALCPLARYLPPVQHGDIHEAVERWSPTVIGIVDGYFQHRPSVWHKEILWAMDQGAHVLGAASMGALRAAELEAFGMVGVGKVYQAFLAGALPPFDGICDDDEVAVTHAPAELGYIAASDAMINIRHTLDAAQKAGVVDEKTVAALIEEAKSLHFSRRTYARIIGSVKEQGVNNDSIERLLAWLPAGRVDQKQQDAIELIEQIARFDREDLPPYTPSFNFEVTEIFHDALLATPISPYTDKELAAHHCAVLDELRLDECAYHDVKREAMARQIVTNRQALASGSGSHGTIKASDEHVRYVADKFRRTNALLDRETVDQWLQNNDLDIAGFDVLVRNEALFDVNIVTPDVPCITMVIVSLLIAKGDYPALSRRAKHKAQLLAMQQEQVLSAQQLLYWHFGTMRDEPMPKDTNAYAQRLGLAREADLVTLLARENQYLAQLPVDLVSEDDDG